MNRSLELFALVLLLSAPACSGAGAPIDLDDDNYDGFRDLQPPTQDLEHDPPPAPGVCGDSMVGFGEQCDGTNLAGFTCVDMGYDGGTLACKPVLCTYDLSGCTND